MMVEYITLGVYFLLLLVIGARFARFNRDMSDFVRGGARATWWMVGTSITMAGISAFTFTGNAAAAFEAGPSLLVIYLANVLGLLLGGWFLARWYRQTRAYTAMDVVRGRYGTVVEQFCVYFGLLLAPVTAAVQLWALAVFVSAIFGFPLFGSILVIGGITLAYSCSGGMWAVMATDVVQAVILYGITLLMAVLAVMQFTSFSALTEALSSPDIIRDFSFVNQPDDFESARFSWGWIMAIFLMQFFSQINLASSGKYLACKDGAEASKASYWAMVLMGVGAVIWFIPPMVARLQFEQQVLAMEIADPATASYAVAAQALLPAGMLGIMIAAMFSATMSSMDMGLTSQTGIIVRNLLPRLLQALRRPQVPAEKEVLLCRVVTLCLGAVIIGISLLLASQGAIRLFDIFLYIGSMVGVPMSIPLVAGLLLRRLPSWSYFLMFGGALLPSLGLTVAEYGWGYVVTIQERAAWAMAGGALMTGLSFLLGPYAGKEQRIREEKFFHDLHRPIEFEKEIGGNMDREQAKLTGQIVIVLGLLVLLLLIGCEGWNEVLAVGSLSGFVFLCGFLLLSHGKAQP